MFKLKLELIYKAFLRSKSFSLIFMANFTLAIFSLIFLQFFKNSVETSLESKAKTLLGADLVVTSRFPISDEQVKDIKDKLPEIKKDAKVVTTVSMVASSTRSRLFEVIELQEGFPFYGNLTFSDQEVYPEKVALLGDQDIWIHTDGAKLLDLNIGDTLRVGNKTFVIKKIVSSDSQKATNFSGFMPRVYLSKSGLKRSELIQFGSTARYKLHYQFKDNLTNDQLENIEDKLEKSIDRNLRVLSPNDGRDRLIRILSFLTNFLSLVSLISFFLGLVGLVYLYSGFLNKHKKDMKVLNDLGIGKRDLCFTYLLHLMTLIVVSSLFVFGLIYLAGPVLEPIVKKYVDFKFIFTPDYSFFFKSFLALVTLSISIGLPLVLPILDFKNERPKKLKGLFSFLPFILVLMGVAHFVSPMRLIGGGFSLVIFLIIACLFLIGFIFLRKIDFSGHTSNLALSLALKNITRQKKTSLTLFSAILLCVSLFSLIPQVGSSLSKALSLSVEKKPRFFVVDAKEEQLPEIAKEVKELGGKLENISPMVRGRIIKVNNTDFREHSKKHSEESEDGENDELKNRAVNLSYRQALKESEEIVKGRDFSGTYNSPDFQKPVEVSVEERYAKRRGLKVGDRLNFDVLGLELPAEIINIRTVKWTDFVPNFFLILQDGALNDAPKTVLATISYELAEAQKVLLKLSDLFPSLTIIDVKNLFNEFAKLVSAVTSITDRMSFFSILIGLIMSFIIIQYQMNLQKNNILRLKMIGIKNSIIKKSLLIEYGLITITASFLGIILGSVGSYITGQLVFESYWSLRPLLLALYFILIPLLTVLIVNIFANRVINQKENQLFSE